jgi:hypothetical protein
MPTISLSTRFDYWGKYETREQRRMKGRKGGKEERGKKKEEGNKDKRTLVQSPTILI